MNRLASRGRSRRSIDDGDNDSMSDNSNRSSSMLKGRFNMKRGSSRNRIRLMDDGDSESVSDVSVGSSSSVRSSASKYESIRSKMKRAGDKLKRGTSRARGRTETNDGDSDSVSEYSMASRFSEVSRYKAVRSTLKRAGSKIVRKKSGEHPQPSILDVDGAEHLVGSTILSHSDDTNAHAMQNLMKNAKSRFNIGVVYLKTGDYEKSRENLEHSLHCHTQLAGHDTESYTHETLFAIAAVHEKLGDCYSAKSNISNNSIAVGNYQESRRLLQLIDPDDASDNVIEMLERVGDQLKSPGLRGIEGRRRPLPQTNDSTSREMNGNADMNDPPSPSPPKFEKSTDANKLNFVANIMVGKFKGDELDRTCSSESLSDSDAENFAHAMLYLDRSDHQMAFDHLSSMQVMESMNNIGFRDEFVSNMMTVASSALGAGKTRLAVDAFEAAYTLLKTLRAEPTTKEKWQSLLVKSKLPSSTKSCMPGVHSDLVFARRGCIKSHKAMALEMESAMDYDSAIQQRIRVKELLEEDEQCIPACKQLMKIAYLHGEMKCDYDQCSSILGVLVQKLCSSSPDKLPVESLDLLIQCYHMGAICYSKASKWNEAILQYDALLPLLAKTKGPDCREYNSASIQMAALLVKTGQYDHALNAVIKYFDLAEKSSNTIVDDSDHILAMDVYTALLLYVGDVDKAKDVLERKLTFLHRLPKKDELKSDAMYKLGCLLAFKKEHHLAVPMLNEALESRKRLYDGGHKAVFESMWAVATSAQSLGDIDRSIKAYSELANKKNIMKDPPVDIIRVHNSAGKLYFEDGHADKSVASFRQAVKEAETRHDDEQTHVAELNLANALSSVGMPEEAMELYDKLVSKKALKLSKIFFLALFNKSLLLLKMGEDDEAFEILYNIDETVSENADDVRGRVCLLLGIVAESNGQRNKAQSYFEKSLIAAGDDLSSIVYSKICIGQAFVLEGQYDEAIAILDDLLEDLSAQGGESKPAKNLLKADIWNCMARVYKSQGNLPQAKNFAKLALQILKSVLGEVHPTTLRNISNLQLLLLEEAEGMDKSEAKFVVDVAKYEMEDTLDAFESLTDPSSHRFAIASLKINLGLVAVWQGKPKKARRYLRQVEEVAIPSDHLLMRQIAMLEGYVVQLEKNEL